MKICFILFLLDIVIIFNKGIIKKSVLILNRKSIAMKYMKKEFILDVIFVIVLFVYNENIIQLNTIYKYLLCFIFLKVYKAIKIFDKLFFYLNYESNLKNTVDLLRLILKIITVCHILSLFWHDLA